MFHQYIRYQGRGLIALEQADECCVLYNWKFGRRIAETTLPSGVYISTVFLKFDHNFGYGQGGPVLWETMVFGGPCSDMMLRYRSEERARRGHRLAVRLAMRAEERQKHDHGQPA